MGTELRPAGCAVLAALAWAHTVAATSLPALSFEELTDQSDLIVTGNVVRSWSAWDAGGKYIWTHYEIAVDAAQKGASAGLLDIAEPGGVVAGVGMTIAGSVSYQPGENVVVFAQRMPNGFLRTTGWGQGKYSVDHSGLLHADTALKSVEIVDARQAGAGDTPLRTLNGMSVQELGARVSARVLAARAQAAKEQLAKEQFAKEQFAKEKVH